MEENSGGGNFLVLNRENYIDSSVKLQAHQGQEMAKIGAVLPPG
jgi:hypothetical protein